MNRRVLVLGGAGFLGKQLIAALIQKKFKKVASVDVINCETESVINHIVDVFDKISLSEICLNYDTIINCTGQITTPINLSFRLNTLGSTNIAEICVEQNKKLIHISTTVVYGSAKYVNESTVLNPETPYACLKAGSEFIFSKIMPAKNLIILRLSNLYGTNQPKGVVGYLFKSYKSDKILEFNDEGSKLRYFQNTTDIAQNIIRIIIKDGIQGIFNLPGNECLSLFELVDLTEKITGIKFNVDYKNSGSFENIIEIDCKKITSMIDELNYQTTLSSFIKQYFK